MKKITTVYFIRHAQSDRSVRDGRIRPLTDKGRNDCVMVTEYLSDKNIDIVFSSPFKRAVDTIADFAAKNNLKINIIEDFREQSSSSDMPSDSKHFYQYFKKQWADFNYTLSDGESLAEVQKRNVKALQELLINYKDKNIAVGTHATALSVIINYYDGVYGFADFKAMEYKLPWIVKMSFNGNNFVGIEKIDLFTQCAE